MRPSNRRPRSGPVRVNEACAVAAAEEAFVIKRLGRERRLAPIARRDVGAAVAHLHLAAGRRQLHFNTGCGQAHQAGLPVGQVRGECKGRRLGHAQAHGHRNAAAHGLHGHGFDGVFQRRRQGSARWEYQLQPAEKALAQGRVIFHGLRQHLQAFGHGVVHRGGDLAQVAHGLADALGGGATVVDVHRAAVAKDQPEIRAATGHVMPRQPVHQGWRLLVHKGVGLAIHDRVATHHAVRGHHGLGHLGGA